MILRDTVPVSFRRNVPVSFRRNVPVSFRRNVPVSFRERAGVAETAMFRMKNILGDHLSARLLEMQTSQAVIRCAALNRMTHLEMPQSYKVTA